MTLLSVRVFNAWVPSSVLVVEDDPSIRIVLRTGLEDDGYQVIEAGSAEQALARMAETVADVILVDLRLPGMQGLDLIRRVRETSHVPIIVVTAQTASHDVIAGLEAGADDYVTKPFVTKELSARIRSQLRRSRGPGTGDRVLKCGRIELETGAAQLRHDGIPVALTPIEFDVLVELLEAQGGVLSRDYLLRKVWGYSHAGDGRVVDNLMYRLRIKIEDDPSHPVLLRTVRGFGYRLSV